jgi:predicted XRE-type DNA-binding protein
VKKKAKTTFEESSGNVFADLGRKDAEGLYLRARLGAKILQILHNQGLSKQKDVQEVLDIGQAEVSKLLNARFHRFSEGRLMIFLNKLDQKVTVKIVPRRRGEKPREVVFA